MRNQMPFQWIEEAEARTIRATALFEQAAAPSTFRRVREEALERLQQLGLWLADSYPVGSQGLQPVPVRRQPPQMRRRADDEADPYRW
jgi:hypothetical protein